MIAKQEIFKSLSTNFLSFYNIYYLLHNKYIIYFIAYYVINYYNKLDKELINLYNDIKGKLK